MSQPPEPTLLKKLGWFVALWVAGVLAVSLLAVLVRIVYPTT